MSGPRPGTPRDPGAREVPQPASAESASNPSHRRRLAWKTLVTWKSPKAASPEAAL